MKILENEFVKSGRQFENVHCDKNTRIWKVSQNGTIWFECHLRKYQKESKMKNLDTGIEVTFEAKERFPSDESFGAWAWTYKTVESCHERLAQILALQTARLHKALLKAGE